MTVHTQLQPYIDAWTHSIEAIHELVAPLPESEWNRPTECPAWSVRDIVSHIIGSESELLGDPRPIHPMPSDVRHMTNDFARYLELPVDVRRCHTAAEQVAELDYTIIRRSRQLRNEKRYPQATARGLMGREATLETVLWSRAFDVWVHEQDLRRALGAPGNLDSPGAHITRDWLLRALPEVVSKGAAAPAGSTVVVDVHGPLEFFRTVRVGRGGYATIDSRVSLGPNVTLATDWETYVRLACGRVRPSAVAGQIKLEGEDKMAQAVLAAMAVTQ